MKPTRGPDSDVRPAPGGVVPEGHLDTRENHHEHCVWLPIQDPLSVLITSLHCEASAENWASAMNMRTGSPGSQMCSAFSVRSAIPG